MPTERAAALATLAVAGVASAQSSVTLFGIVDAGVSYYNAKGGNLKQTQWAQSSSGYNSSRIGFRGTEDLGGGLAAGFWLEGGLNNDVGQGKASGGGLDFQRRSTVSLSGPFGEVRLGRDFTPTFWNNTAFDPFGTNGVGTNIIDTAESSAFGGTNPQYVRSSNTVGYFLPANIGGFYGQVQYGFHEQVNALNVNPETGEYMGGRFGYANGPLDVALAYGESTILDNGLGNENKRKTVNLGASYDFSVVKLFGELSQAKIDRTVGYVGLNDQKISGDLLGISAPIGAGLIRASYSGAKFDNGTAAADPKSSKLAVGYVYNLSKRTALYATYAHIWNRNGATLTTGGSPVIPAFSSTGKSSANGYDFGVRHAF